MRMAFALFASLAAVGLSTPSSAQVISVSQVLVTCPDFALAQACPPMATQFLEDRRPGLRRNGQVVDLVVGIAQVAQHESVPRRVCLNAADGLRVLAAGVTNVDQVNQILDIADALCLGNRTAAIGGPGLVDSLSTSSVGGGNPGGGTPGGVGSPGGDDDFPDDDICVFPRTSSCNGNSENSNVSDEALNNQETVTETELQESETEATETAVTETEVVEMELTETETEVTETEETETVSGGLGSNDAASDPNANALENANEHATDNTQGQNGQEHEGGPPEVKGKDK